MTSCFKSDIIYGNKQIETQRLSVCFAIQPALENSHREVIRLAGNATDARIRAENALRQAKAAGADQKDIAILQSAYDAARTEELRQTGKNEQARPLF